MLLLICIFVSIIFYFSFVIHICTDTWDSSAANTGPSVSVKWTKNFACYCVGLLFWTSIRLCSSYFIHKAEYGVVSIHTAWPNAWNSSKQISWMWNPKVILNSSSLINECILPENSQYVIFITEPDDYYALTNLNTNKATLLLHVFLKHCSSALVATMFYLFTTSLNTSIIPTE